MHGCMKWAFALLCPSRDSYYNSKAIAIASYTQTVMQAFLKISIMETILGCDQTFLYLCSIATSFVHTADLWGLNL